MAPALAVVTAFWLHRSIYHRRHHRSPLPTIIAPPSATPSRILSVSFSIRYLATHNPPCGTPSNNSAHITSVFSITVPISGDGSPWCHPLQQLHLHHASIFTVTSSCISHQSLLYILPRGSVTKTPTTPRHTALQLRSPTSQFPPSQISPRCR